MCRGNQVDENGDDVMSEIDIDKIVSEMKRFTSKIQIDATQKDAVENLIKIGVLKKDGKTLTEHQLVK